MDTQELVEEMARTTRATLYDGEAGSWNALPRAQREAWNQAVMAALHVLARERPATSGVVRAMDVSRHKAA